MFKRIAALLSLGALVAGCASDGGAKSMRIFACTQVGFSAAACAGGAATPDEMNAFQTFSNSQGEAGYHYYLTQTFNVGGKPTAYFIYEKP